jgi:hypothetical protein
MLSTFSSLRCGFTVILFGSPALLKQHKVVPFKILKGVTIKKCPDSANIKIFSGNRIPEFTVIASSTWP